MSSQLALFAAQWKRESPTLWTFGELAIEQEGQKYGVYRGRKLLTKPFSKFADAKKFVEDVARTDATQP